MKICGSEKMIDQVPVVIICEAYWESLYTYDLSNLLDNPGFEEWNAGICNSQPDCWVDYQAAGATGENNQETEVVEEGCEALRIELAATPAGQYQGVTQNICTRIRVDTEYTLLAWVQNAALTNGKVYIFVEGAGAAVRGTAINDGVARTDYTLVSCQFTPLAGDIAANVHIRVRLEAVGGACTGQCRIDKMLVMESSNVPVAWMSSSYITNNYDHLDPNEVNFLSVLDIPGEVPAETDIVMDLQDENDEFHCALKVGNDPCKFGWVLAADAAYTSAETGGAPCAPALIDANCFDTDKAADGTAIGGCRIECDFVTRQTDNLRCFWRIPTDLLSYSGRYMVAVLAKASAAVDVIRMRIRVHQSHAYFGAPDWLNQIVPTAVDWELMTGWTVVQFPIGIHKGYNYGVGDYLALSIFASITGASPWDELHIGGAFLIPVDEGYVISGNLQMDDNYIVSFTDLDGDLGCFAYYETDDQFYPNIGMVGNFPRLHPRAANYLYFLMANDNELDITDKLQVSLRYRPQGIFLRGLNP